MVCRRYFGVSLIARHARVLWCLPLCVPLWFLSSPWEDPKNYESFFYFIYFIIHLCIQPFFFFHSVALFPPKLTNILELTEYDPLTAVWNNEASFPHIFSPRMDLPLTALRSTSKCLIIVESGAEGIIDHTESLGLHIYCLCTEGEVVLWSQKPYFQSQETTAGHIRRIFIFFVVILDNSI